MSATRKGIEARLSGRLGGFSLDVAFTAPARGITALFGPSGCGKTTILRSVAGLQRLSGRLVVEGEVWQDEQRFLPPHRRGAAYVFQEPSLFPHLDVRGNLDFGRRRLASGTQPTARFEELVALLGLERLLARRPQALSGGERQRVSLARALLAEPRLLLMDEPLSALDQDAKDEILPYLETLHARLSIPAILVTHDRAEVERLADRVVVLEAGRVVGAGSIAEVLADPALPFAARQGAASVLRASVVGHEDADDLAVLDLGGHRLLIAGPERPPGTPLRLRVRAADVSLALAAPQNTTILNVLPATIRRILPVGPAELDVSLELRDGQFLAARITRRSARLLELSEGQTVQAQMKGVSLSGAVAGG
ncbi:molybdenum ABC transporter ATP-binding protein [Aureimonas sp. AU4]|uniref:molybdenum ABC transporter ATP-binding protein n=1 Tax=Aureimonas sp. AU4 TaxID=1638163 RepID=UPI00078603FB|nr:molybdenum ABC transporter ATP-binding protein [Aureimonas sp. AU4]